MAPIPEGAGVLARAQPLWCWATCSSVGFHGRALPFISLQKLEPARAERAGLVERLGWVHSVLCQSSLCHSLNLRKDMGSTRGRGVIYWAPGAAQHTEPKPSHCCPIPQARTQRLWEESAPKACSKWQSHHSDPESPGSGGRCER